MRRVICSCVLLLSATAAAQSTKPSTQLSDLDQDRLDAKAMIDRDMQGLTSLGEHELNQVIRFEFEDGRLRSVCDLNVGDDDFHTLKINGLPGAVKLRIETRRAAGQNVDRKYTHFFYYDLTQPGCTEVYTDVDCTPETVGVAQFIDTPTRDIIVQYGENTMLGPQSVNLYIQIIPEEAPGPDERRHISGSSLIDLARGSPAEVDYYLRPIFRLLGQEQTVFQVDSRTAYQVFAPDCKSSAATIAAANAALEGLAADSYPDREAATARLAALGEPAAIYLMSADPRYWTIEQAMRVDQFLSEYRPLTDDMAGRMHSDPDFLLDCLFNSDPAIRRLALARLDQITEKTIPWNDHWTGNELDDAVTKLRAALGPSLPPFQ